jgi:type I restriction enzyme S subunit
MAGDWETIALEKLVEPGRGISYGIVQPGTAVADGVPIVRVTDVRDGRIATSAPLRVAPNIEAAYSRTRLAGGELLLTLVGTVGESAVVPESLAGWNTARAVAVIPVRKDIGAYWVRLALRAPGVRHIIDSRLNTTVQVTLNLGDVAQLPIVLPPPREREAIAHILGTLDDKIELNRRMSETLEAMARALFRSWFVDFDPVRAKAEGRDTGLPPDIADLFPNAFEDSELGGIPRGWEAGCFGDFVAQRSERVGPRAVVVLSAVASGRLTRSDDHFVKRVYSQNTDKYLAVEQYDFAYNPSRINIGSIGMLGEDVFGGVSPVYVVVRPKPAYRWFLEFSLRRPRTRAWINTLASGSVRQSLSYVDFASIPCVVAPEEVVRGFDREWTALHQAIHLHDNESRTLGVLRDTLLPKLLSGELCLVGPVEGRAP